MPAQFDSDGQPDIRVTPAPLLEMESALCGICGHSRMRWEGLVERAGQDEDLARRITDFWKDDGVEWLEYFFLLDQAGLVLEQDPEPVLARIAELASRRYTVPELPSEEAGLREVVQARLDRLAESPALREQYAGILKDLWGVARSDWLEEGKGIAEEAAARIRARLQSGESVLDVLPTRHFARNDAYRSLLNGRSPIVIVPLGLSSKVKFILQAEGGPVYVGFGSQAEQRSEEKKRRMEEAAAAFKVLSDPTRLGILEYFLWTPASVSDLARVFEVSQPTISAHVKMLREAGLLNSSRKGTHTLYRADRNRVRGFIDKQAEVLVEGGG